MKNRGIKEKNNVAWEVQKKKKSVILEPDK